jgi:hypothetical protein
MKCVQDRKWNPTLNEKVEKIMNLMQLDIENSNEIGMKEVSSLIYLEKLIKKKLYSVEK